MTVYDDTVNAGPNFKNNRGDFNNPPGNQSTLFFT